MVEKCWSAVLSHSRPVPHIPPPFVNLPQSKARLPEQLPPNPIHTYGPYTTSEKKELRSSGSVEEWMEWHGGGCEPQHDKGVLCSGQRRRSQLFSLAIQTHRKSSVRGGGRGVLLGTEAGEGLRVRKGKMGEMSERRGRRNIHRNARPRQGLFSRFLSLRNALASSTAF